MAATRRLKASSDDAAGADQFTVHNQSKYCSFRPRASGSTPGAGKSMPAGMPAGMLGPQQRYFLVDLGLPGPQQLYFLVDLGPPTINSNNNNQQETHSDQPILVCYVNKISQHAETQVCLQNLP